MDEWLRIPSICYLYIVWIAMISVGCFCGSGFPRLALLFGRSVVCVSVVSFACGANKPAGNLAKENRTKTQTTQTQKQAKQNTTKDKQNSINNKAKTHESNKEG